MNLMYKRPPQTYNYDKETVLGVINDECSPLNVISSYIENGAKVLDLGAGAGLLADVFLSKSKSVCMDAVELNPYACTLAKKKYRRLYCQDIRKCIDEFALEQYDYIVLADVIEHLEDPQQFLKVIRGAMGRKTKLIVSVPNVAFGAVALSLLEGGFDYTDSGLLEKTHLRFFTFSTLSFLFSSLNLFPGNIFYLHRNFLESEIKITVSLSNLLPIIKLGKRGMASVYQFVFVLGLTDEKMVENHYGVDYRVDIFLLGRYFFRGRILGPLKKYMSIFFK